MDGARSRLADSIMSLLRIERRDQRDCGFPPLPVLLKCPIVDEAPSDTFIIEHESGLLLCGPVDVEGGVKLFPIIILEQDTELMLVIVDG